MATSTVIPLSLNAEETRTQDRVSSIVPCGSSALTIQAQDAFREGMDFLAAGEPSEAIEKLEIVTALAPHYSDGFVALGMAYAMDSRVYPALDSLERAAEVSPSNFYAHFKLAQLHFKIRVPKKGFEEAAVALKSATTIEERKLVAQLLKEERMREANGLARPTWDKPFSKFWVRAGFIMLFLACVILVLQVSRG